MANKHQQEILKQQKIRALLGLITALNDGGIPDTPGVSLSSGLIIECLDDNFLSVPKKAMLEALRDAGVYHDGNNRFTRRMLHAFKERLNDQYWHYQGKERLIIRIPVIEDTGDSQGV